MTPHVRILPALKWCASNLILDAAKHAHAFCIKDSELQVSVNTTRGSNSNNVRHSKDAHSQKVRRIMTSFHESGTAKCPLIPEGKDEHEQGQ